MHGKQQQRAIPIKHAKTTQNMAKKTSNARKTTANLQKFRIREPCSYFLQKIPHRDHERKGIQLDLQSILKGL
jgi:hypothetical protein